MMKTVKKDTILKIRIDSFLKEKVKKNAEVYNWTISKYIRSLIMNDDSNAMFDDIITAIKKNVDTKDETFTFYHEGVKFTIAPDYQRYKKK